MDINVLDKFLIQSLTGNLRTKGLYPTDESDLDIKVSFGMMGTPANVPWISFLGPGMSASNGFFPVYLYYKKEELLILAYGISETAPPQDSWNYEIQNANQKISQLLEKPFRYGDSFVYKYYHPKIQNDQVDYFLNEKPISKQELVTDLKNIISTYKKCLDLELKNEKSNLSQGLFYMEQQLEDFIIQNWDQTELGKKYELIIEDGDIKSQQYRTSIGNIDILARDRETKDYVVIELKKGQTSDETIGQITRYMGWVIKNLKSTSVKGIIIAGKYDEKLNYAQEAVSNVEVFIYEVNFKLNEHKR